MDNLVLSCAFCNWAKHDHDVEKFLAWLAHIRSGYFECRSKLIRNNVLTQCDPSVRDKLQKSWWEDEG